MGAVRFKKLEPSHIRGVCVNCNERPQKAYASSNKYRPICSKCDRLLYGQKSDFNHKVRQIGYDITIEQHEVLKQEQNNLCAICGNAPKTNKRLAIDHDHTTGKVRGLLCDKCNCGLGLFKDSTELLLRAIKYLEKPQ